MDSIGMIQSIDPELGSAMNEELHRQRQNIELIASENIVSPGVMAAMGSVLTNKYAEGLPGKRYYGGCEFVDKVERIAIERACELFGAKYANVQPHSGAQANLAGLLRSARSGRHRYGYGSVSGRSPEPRLSGQPVRQELPLCFLRRKTRMASSTMLNLRRLSRSIARS